MAVDSQLAVERPASSRDARLRRALFRILGALDDTRPTGLLRVLAGDQEVGRLAVARGGVCLAFATTDGDDAPEPGLQDLRDLARAARDSGASLGASVRASGREASLRQALLNETARGLLVMAGACADALPSLELIPARDDYDERLLLGTSEVFLAALRARLLASPDAVARTLDGLDPADAALVLVGSAGSTESPYPVAQRGFSEQRLLHLVRLARLASTLGRARPAPSVEPVPPSGEVWRCVAGDERLVLVRARPDTLATATALALRFVGLDAGDPGLRIHDADAATLLASGVLTTVAPAAEAPALDPAPERSAPPSRVAPRLPGIDVPSGLIWPPGEGRLALDEALATGARVEVAPDGSWTAAGGPWRLHSHAAHVFAEVEAARAALLDWARWHAQAGARLSAPRCALAAQDDTGGWRLWQAVRAERTLRDDLRAAWTRPDARHAARDLAEICRLLTAGWKACRALGLPASLDTLGPSEAGPAFVELAPSLEQAQAAARVSDRTFAADLRAELARLAPELPPPAFDPRETARHLPALTAAAGCGQAGELLATWLAAR